LNLVAIANRVLLPLGRAWPVGYLAGIVLAEVLVVADPAFGMACHLVIVAGLMVQGSLGTEGHRPLVIALVPVPLVRILSLSLPLTPGPVAWRYVLTGLPLLAAALWAARLLAPSRQEIGLMWGRPLTQLGIGLVGAPIGSLTYLILKPAPLVSAFSWRSAVPLSLGLVVAGALEEFIFRGLLQMGAQRVLGRSGPLYASLVSTAMYIGYRSAAMLALTLVVSLGFAWLVARSHSLLGVGLAHGVANILVFVTLPLLGVP
jgi:CAAX protease family protein